MTVQNRNRSKTGNANFGYFAGGNGVISTVDRIDYSNDTATATPKGPLSESKEGMGAGNLRLVTLLVVIHQNQQ